MAEADWSVFTGSPLDTSHVARGVTAAFQVPDGGTTYTFGYRSLSTTTGVAAYYCNLSNFAPGGSLKGGSISAAMKKYDGVAGYAPFIGLLTDKTPAGSGYMLCLTDGASYYKGLKKGSPSSGFDASDSSMLRKSTAAFTASGNGSDAWFHLRLDVLVNPHGEVVLDVYENDLSDALYDVSNTNWQPITGMAQFIDDPLGELSGSLPNTGSFYFVFGHYTEASSGSLSLFDHIVISRQTAP